MLLAGMAGGHHLSAAAVGAAGGHMLGNALDLAGEYISKAFEDEPPIDPDNLTSQRRPEATMTKQSVTTANQPSTPIARQSQQQKPETKIAIDNNHPPIQTIMDIGKEEFTAMRLPVTKVSNWRLFFADNWMMLLAFFMLAIVLVMYVSGGISKKK